METFSRDGDIIKAACAFANFIKADEEFSPREPRERPAACEALQIDDEIKILPAQPADAAEHFRPVLRFAPTFAFKTNHTSEVGITFEQRCERRVNPPKNFRVAEMQF